MSESNGEGKSGLAPATAFDAVADLARSGETERLAAALDAGVAVNASNTRGDTLLLLACYHGREDCVRMLLARGAAVDLANHKGQRPLTGACFKGYVSIVERLLDAGARLEEDDGDIKTPLMYAASFDHGAIVKRLIAAGANVDATTKDGRTALDLARDNLATGVVALLAPDDPSVKKQSEYDWTKM